MSYSGELEVRIRIHMCKKTKQEECADWGASERAKSGASGNKYAKRSGPRPSVRPLRKSSAPIEPHVPRSPFPVCSGRRGKLISIMGSGSGGGRTGGSGGDGGTSDPSSNGGKDRRRRGRDGNGYALRREKKNEPWVQLT